MDNLTVTFTLTVGQINHLTQALTHGPYKDVQLLITFFQGAQQQAIQTEQARIAEATKPPAGDSET